MTKEMVPLSTSALLWFSLTSSDTLFSDASFTTSLHSLAVAFLWDLTSLLMSISGAASFSLSSSIESSVELSFSRHSMPLLLNDSSIAISSCLSPVSSFWVTEHLDFQFLFRLMHPLSYHHYLC